MATIRDLPIETLVAIFEKTSLSTYDLLHISATSPHWQHIASSYKPTQQRLWLLPQPPPAHNPQKEFQLHIALKFCIRRVPATIWNGFTEGMHALTCCLDDDNNRDASVNNNNNNDNERGRGTVRVEDNPDVHPFIHRLGKNMHIINPNFEDDYTNPLAYWSRIVPQTKIRTQQSLLFSSLEELQRKTRLLPRSGQEGGGIVAHWANMLVCRYAIQEMVISGSVDMRLPDGRFEFGDNFCRRVEWGERGDGRLRVVVGQLGSVVRRVARYYKEVWGEVEDEDEEGEGELTSLMDVEWLA